MTQRPWMSWFHLSTRMFYDPGANLVKVITDRLSQKADPIVKAFITDQTPQALAFKEAAQSLTEAKMIRVRIIVELVDYPVPMHDVNEE